MQSSQLTKFKTANKDEDEHKFAEGEARYYASLALKFNLKVGGTNHKLSDSVSLPPRNGSIMFIGISTACTKAESANGSSRIVGVVANIDDNFAHWPGEMRCQTKDDETIKDLDKIVGGRLKKFFENNERYPSRIIVYRAGVSDRQHHKILEDELLAVEKACDKVRKTGPQSKAPSIPTTMIVVSQSHQKRLFSIDPAKAQGQLKNHPNPGTVLRRATTTDSKWDFFLQSHRAREGTVGVSNLFGGLKR